MKLSVVIATYNEAGQIKQCIESVMSIADEIIIIDGSSTDNTRSIARSLSAQVIKTTNKPIFHINKQLGLEKATGDWILQLDADEVVTPKLSMEIKSIINMTDFQLKKRKLPFNKVKLFHRHQSIVESRDSYKPSQNHDINGFYIPRLNMFLGQPLKYGGVYPDGVIRLVKKGYAHFPCQSVHEQIKVDGQLSWLKNELLHYDSPTFKKYIKRANRYTSLSAQKLFNSGVKLSLINDIRYLILKPKYTFLSLYIRHKGFKDGFPGFIWSLFSGLHHALAYMKLGDLYRQEQK